MGKKIEKHKNSEQTLGITLNIEFKDSYIDPVHMILKFVNRMSKQLGVAFYEIRLMHRNTTQFSGAHWGKVRRMGE